jgi:DnaK suppressor protein
MAYCSHVQFLDFSGDSLEMKSAKPKKAEGKDRDSELLEIKELLVQERLRVTTELKKTESRLDIDRDEVTGDDADIASAQLQSAEAKKHGSRLLKLLKKIDYSLSKFEDGTFGVCELTGEDIPIPRLRARPTALYTVEAKEELERKEKRFRSGDTDEDGLDFDDDGE